jgi:peptidoglycan/xylan/chitin deacetylase (PgdA/CDA1 family)
VALTSAGVVGLDHACPPPSPTPVRAAPGSGRTVALTFDDGPSIWTARLLDVLRAKGVHATFFVIGQDAQRYPALLREAAAQGHLIGNHTWDHAYPNAVRGGWSSSYLADQLARTSAVVQGATGQVVCWFRPPGGNLPKTVLPASKRLGMSVVLWSVDPRDWAIQSGSRGSTGWVDRIVTGATEGLHQQHPVVLLHDGGGFRGATVAAVAKVIDAYRAHGYQFVRLDGTS